MMRKLIWKTALVFSTVAALAGLAFAFSLIFSFQGTVASYDFGGFGPGHDIQGTVEMQAFTLNPGEVVPWHYHKGLSYVVLTEGNLIEQELTNDGNCGRPRKFGHGAAFVETAGRRHTVMNPGPNTAVIYWATIFPKGDPNGDAVFVDSPTCH